MLVTLEEQFSESSQILEASDLLIKLRVDDDVEVIVDLSNLSQVLVLHPSSCNTLFAIFGWVRETNLVNDDVADVDLLLCHFDG